MISAAIGRGDSEGHPQIAIVVTVTINSIGADSRIRGKCASGFLVRPQDWIQTGDSRKVRFVFPESFAALGLRWRQKLRRSETPDRTDVHRHDATGVWVKANVEFALAAF